MAVAKRRPTRSNAMIEDRGAQNKALVLGAFDALFNHKNFAAAETLWAEEYIQHSSLIAPGREGLFALVRNGPDTMHYENNLIMCEGDTLILHGRFSGTGKPDHIVVDVVRLEGGRLKEHWDVWQAEATKAESLSGLPMFGESFPQ
jgi:predicted SnoaL-like aldol condensation-catalyzing enzyme